MFCVSTVYNACSQHICSVFLVSVCIWLALSCCCLFCILSSLFFNLCLCSKLNIDGPAKRKKRRKREKAFTIDPWPCVEVRFHFEDCLRSFNPTERAWPWNYCSVDSPKKWIWTLDSQSWQSAGLSHDRLSIGGGALWERAEVWSMSREHS